MTRIEALRPIVTAIGLTFFGEMAILLLWGVWLPPAGSIWPKLLRTATCGVAMGATIGALTICFVIGRLRGLSTLIATGTLYIFILTYGTFLCFAIDLDLRLFAAREAPMLFILGALVPTAASTPLFVWRGVSEHDWQVMRRRLNVGRTWHMHLKLISPSRQPWCYDQVASAPDRKHGR